MSSPGFIYPIGTGLPMAQRSLTSQIVRRFKGLNRYTSLSNVGGDWAVDLLNVIVSSSGDLNKMRLPLALTVAHTAAGPNRFFDFQQGNGTRQIFANFGNELAWFDIAAAYAFHTIETDVSDAPSWDWASANNILFGANSVSMKKWTGAALQTWGIAQPAAAPTVGRTMNITSIQRAGNVVTVTYNDPLNFTMRVGDIPFVQGVSDPSFNGQFVVASVTGVNTFTYAQVAANAGPLASGTLTLFSALGEYAISNITRVAGLATLTTTLNVAFATGDIIDIVGVGDASFNVTNVAITVTAPNVMQFAQGLLPDVAPLGAGGTIKLNFTLSVGKGALWRYSYANSVTGHVGAASNTTVQGQCFLDGFRRFYPLNGLATADTQVDTVWWFRTFDGGGNWYLEATTPYVTGQIPVYTSRIPDANLDQTQQAPLLNLPPIVGKFLSVWAGRVFVSGLTGAPQDLIYTGYERILVGRPEESFPPFNRLRLSIGADSINGHGAIQAGIVAFSKSAKMFMFRGIPEDVVVSSPLLFSAYLEELPWQIGCLSHYTVCSTPYGLVWVAADRTVMQYDGVSKPVCMSAPVHPLLKSITAGREGQCRSSYFNWLDKDWYCLTCPINNSAVNNAIFFFDLEAEPDLNCGVFYSNIEADDIRVIEDVNGQRQLCISAGGIISSLQVELATVGGIGIAPRAPTGGVLTAYWQSGYFGNETPQQRRMFRYARYVADAAGFAITANLVNDDIYTFQNPLVKSLSIIIPPQPVGLANPNITNARASIDVKSRRCSLKIQFPNADADANLLQLFCHSIATSEV